MNFSIYKKLKKVEFNIEKTLQKPEIQNRLTNFGFPHTSIRKGKEMLQQTKKLYLEYKNLSVLRLLQRSL